MLYTIGWLALLLAACAAAPTQKTEANPGAIPPPLPNFEAPFDVQIRDAYEPDPRVMTVLRDRNENPLVGTGRYSICYINGLQTQDDELDEWKRFESESLETLILRDLDNPDEWIKDAGPYDEFILDISTQAKRAALIDIMREWINGCHEAGFQAVDFDNLDTYDRFPDRFTEDDAVAYIQELNAIVHSFGMAVSQKNASGLAYRQSETKADFVIVEQCSEDGICTTYTDHFGSSVFMIEFLDDAFDRACTRYGEQYSIILRDSDFHAPYDSGEKDPVYIYDDC